MCFCESVYIWIINEDEEDYIFEDFYMKDIEFYMYEDEVLELYLFKF